MLRAICTALLLCLSIGSVRAHSPSYCKTHVYVVPDHPIDSRFMYLAYHPLMYALAEKFCGAHPFPMTPIFLPDVEHEGCGPETDVHKDLVKTINLLENASLVAMATDGDPKTHLTKKQSKQWAATTVRQLGGCQALVKWHDANVALHQ